MIRMFSAIIIGFLGFSFLVALIHAAYLIPQMVNSPPVQIFFPMIAVAQIVGSGNWQTFKTAIGALSGKRKTTHRERIEIGDLIRMLVVGVYCGVGMAMACGTIAALSHIDEPEKMGPGI